MKIHSLIIGWLKMHFSMRRTSAQKLDETLRLWRPFLIKSEARDFDAHISNSNSVQDSNFKNNLEEHGVAIVPNFLDRELCREISNFVFEDIANLKSESKNREWRGAKVVHPEDQNLGYTSMALGGTPIITIRGGSDLGMIDIFHPEKLFPKLELLVSAISASSIDKEISSVSETDMALQNVNLYINQDVEQTRGFHVDSWGVNQFKAFVYLTDVNELEDGPYTYVLGSSKDRELEVLNKKMNRSVGAKSTDFGLFSPSKVMPVLAKAGSLVVSNQTGAHGGWPQKKGHSRCVLTLNFREVR